MLFYRISFSTTYIVPRVFSAISVTLPCVFWYSVAARLVGSAAMSTSPLVILPVNSSGRAGQRKGIVLVRLALVHIIHQLHHANAGRAVERRHVYFLSFPWRRSP